MTPDGQREIGIIVHGPSKRVREIFIPDDKLKHDLQLNFPSLVAEPGTYMIRRLRKIGAPYTEEELYAMVQEIEAQLQGR